LAKTERALVLAFRELIGEGMVALVGPVRQEILTGIRDAIVFDRLQLYLRNFDDEPLTTPDFELAARFAIDCRHAGISGSPIDFLLCAVAVARDWSIFTTDRDFDRYAGVLPIRTHTV
jgi:predicted nucleic acid-binding protein